MSLPEKVREKLRDIPDKPGCYMMRDRRGRIIYVGKASSLKKRVQSYFRQATFRGASPKLKGLISSVHDLDYVVVRNEAEAVLTEGRLIKDYKPRYNVSFRDDKRFLLLRADERDPFPRLRLCRIKRDDSAAYYGPYASSAAARATLDFVEKRFGLRKCTTRIPGEEAYKHCIDDIIRHCSAPCVGKVTKEEYFEKFTEACAFLRGQRPKYLKELGEAMEAASASLEFERAAVLRDTLFSLRAAVKQSARVAATPEMKRQESLAGIEELRKALKLNKPPRVIEAFDVSNISGTYSVASMVCFVDGAPRRNRYRRFRIRTVKGSDDPRMMAEAVNRRFGRLLREGGELPDLVLVDGGAGQLRAACRELANLGITGIAAAGLAKRFEEMYRPGERRPVRFARDSRALKVLQRVRDEAHRFAITYHLRLRSRRIRESVLDDVPGVGPSKKQALLAHFGSVRRLMKATAEEIAEAPGIGRKLAEAISAEMKTVGGRRCKNSNM